MQSIANNITINVNVEGGSGGQEADRQTCSEYRPRGRAAVNAKVAGEIRNQFRSGNMLNPVTRL
jgi:hypothetical protein